MYVTRTRRNIIEWRARYDASAPPTVPSTLKPVYHRQLIYSRHRRVIVWQNSGAAGFVPPVPTPQQSSAAAPSVMGGGMPGARKRKAIPPSGKVRFVGERKRKKEEEVYEVQVAAEAAARLKAATTFTPEDFELMSLFSFMR